MTTAHIRDYNRFEGYAQAIWASNDFCLKKTLILEAISRFEFKKKVDQFIATVNGLTNSSRGCQKIDKLIADLVLIQSGDRVIK